MATCFLWNMLKSGHCSFKALVRRGFYVTHTHTHTILSSLSSSSSSSSSHFAGMSAIVRSFYRRKNAKDTTSDVRPEHRRQMAFASHFETLEHEGKAPFVVGNVKPGNLVNSFETNMYRCPMKPHAVRYIYIYIYVCRCMYNFSTLVKSSDSVYFSRCERMTFCWCATPRESWFCGRLQHAASPDSRSPSRKFCAQARSRF